MPLYNCKGIFILVDFINLFFTINNYKSDFVNLPTIKKND